MKEKRRYLLRAMRMANAISLTNLAAGLRYLAKAEERHEVEKGASQQPWWFEEQS